MSVSVYQHPLPPIRRRPSGSRLATRRLNSRHHLSEIHLHGGVKHVLGRDVTFVGEYESACDCFAHANEAEVEFGFVEA